MAGHSLAKHESVVGLATENYSRDSLSKQVDRIESELARLRSMLRSRDAQQPREEVSAGSIRSIIAARRRRETLFGPGFFADPAWDILLELYAMKLAGDTATVGHLCNVAAVPATTALGWIKQLERGELVVRTPDKSDRRRIFVELSEHGAAMMERYFRDPEANVAGI